MVVSHFGFEGDFSSECTISLSSLAFVLVRVLSCGPNNQNNCMEGPKVYYTTERSKAVPLMWFTVLLVFVPISVLFLRYMCLDDI